VTWEAELEELARRRDLACRMGGEERVARQHAAGKLTARERVELLLDAESFREIGTIAGKGRYEEGRLAEFSPANFLFGTGTIRGRRIAVPLRRGLRRRGDRRSPGHAADPLRMGRRRLCGAGATARTQAPGNAAVKPVEVKAETVGNVWEIRIEAGAAVDAGAEILILESMKREIPIEAPRAASWSAFASRTAMP
jgi:hypothetical protein